MEKRTILIDMDDVLAEMTTSWINILNKRHGISIVKDDLKVWNIGRSLPLKFPGLTNSDIYAPLEEPGFFRNFSVMPGAKSQLKQIKDLGWRSVIVTSLPIVDHKPGLVVQEKCEWIEEHFIGLIEPRDMIITYQKNLVKGDVLIDDAPHNIKSFRGPTIVFDRPWNREIVGTARVSEWSEIIDICKKIFLVRPL